MSSPTRDPDQPGGLGPGQCVDLAQIGDFRLGQLLVRPSIRQLEAGGGSEPVAPRVMQVLVVLAQAEDQVVGRQELIDRCWGGRIVGDDAINRCIVQLRRLARRHGAFRIDTIARVGYRLRPTAGGAGKPRSVSSPVQRTVALGAVIVAALVAIGAAIELPSRLARSEPALQPVHPSRPGPSPMPVAGKTFRDCDNGCPTMVVIPRGGFTMGRPEAAASSDETPREVRIGYDLAVSQHPVTRRTYGLFVTETGRRDLKSCFSFTPGARVLEGEGTWRNPGFAQSQDDPAVCISWDDAVAFTEWLRARTGQPYRLLSEAEWEYAARAGGPPVQPAGPPCGRLNGADQSYARVFTGDQAVERGCADGYVYTSPVGRFPANAWGLSDMLGNVWEWTQDCYDPRPPGAPHDGHAWELAACSLRVVRGGSWIDDPARIRVTRRQGGSPADRYPTNGFRVARDLS